MDRIADNEYVGTDLYYYQCENYVRPLNIIYINIWWNGEICH